MFRRGESHPYLGLLADRGVRTLWGGQALSDAGSELYRLGAIWLAVRMAGPDAAVREQAEIGVALASPEHDSQPPPPHGE